MHPKNPTEQTASSLRPSDLRSTSALVLFLLLLRGLLVGGPERLPLRCAASSLSELRPWGVSQSHYSERLKGFADLPVNLFFFCLGVVLLEDFGGYMFFWLCVLWRMFVFCDVLGGFLEDELVE